jgi:hypothetical protein
MATPAIEFADVTKVYQRRFGGTRMAALADVSFEVGRGEGSQRSGQDNQHEYLDGVHPR